MVDFIEHNVRDVSEKITRIAKDCGRDRNEIKLMGVSKFHPLEMMIEASRWVDLLGENRVQEASEKRAGWSVGNKTPWHLIGHLQKNKARKALETFDLIESVDSFELAQTLDRILEKTGRESFPVFIEVNMSGETSKNGVAPASVPGFFENVLAQCPRLRVEGLMTLGPLTEDERSIRTAFSGLRDICVAMRAEFGLPLPELSMGMSGDFAIAIQEGSTIVRIGTAIFGPRNL